MEVTYSKHALDAIVEREINLDWIVRTIEFPALTETDREDRELTHYLARIPENGSRVLRVIVNNTVSPLHVVSVFFDRRMRKKL